ncbi:MAG TPA: glycoside-pentoside-hexuronide (GPH):cation symporter [Bacteroidales bacterium]|nr:glycoside-pentoside-hexuronide (GPH):cation symporter [Bacteroidales bacterium]
MESTHTKLKFREKVGYGFGDLGSVLFWQTIMVYLLYFYTDVFGLTAATAGVMFFVSRVLDAFFDVVIGMTADRTETRWGKFRPYILFGAVPLAVAAVAAFTVPSFGGTGKIVYAYITFLSFMFLYSTVNIPYTSLLGVISNDAVDRTSASSFKFIGAYLAGIIVSATALPFAKMFGKGGTELEIAQSGWHTTMLIYAIAAVLFFFITFLSTKERIKPIAKEKTNIKSDLKDISKNIPWMVLFAITILFILFNCIRLNVTTHYFKYYVGEQSVPWLTDILNFFRGYIINPIISLFGNEKLTVLNRNETFGFEALTSIFNTVGQTLSLIGVILVPWFAKTFGRKEATIILFVTALICTGSFIFFSPENIFLILFFQAIGSITGGPISALLWVMYADTADYSEWKTGRRATGLIFSASIMSNKLGWAFGSMIAAFILASTGFVANVTQNAGTLNGLKSMMSVIPVIPGLLALTLLIFFYKLDEKTMKKVQEDLNQRRIESGSSAI